MQLIKEAFPDVPEILLTQDQNDAEEEYDDDDDDDDDDDGELEEIQSDIGK